MCAPVAVPLEKFFFLDQSLKLICAPLSAFIGVQRLLQTAFIPYYRTDRMPLILDRLALLAEHIPFYSLAYQLGSDILSVISEP